MGLLRSGTLYIGCGVSVDTRMALGGDGGGRYDTLGCGETVSRPELVIIFGLVGALARLSLQYETPPSPPSATRVSTDTSQPICNVPLLRRLMEAQIRAQVPFAI